MLVSIPIHVDLSEVAEEFSFSEEQQIQFTQSIVSSIASQFIDNLQSQAQLQLHSTRNRYLRAIQTFSDYPGHAAVVLSLNDKLVRMIEEGKGPFDMKVGMLNSPKAKTNKEGGKYLTIPFRWATPNAIGESEVFTFKMPDEIHAIVKKKELTIPVVGGGIKSAGLTVQEIPEMYRVKTGRQPILSQTGKTLFDAYQHKSNIYEGLSKYQDDVTSQNTYKSFRRVSENSDPDAFIHPGIKEYNLFQLALNDMDINMQNNLEISIDKTLSQMGFS